MIVSFPGAGISCLRGLCTYGADSPGPRQLRGGYLLDSRGLKHCHEWVTQSM